MLHAHQPRRGDLVKFCSRAAYQTGVRPEMPLAEAKALLYRDYPEASRAQTTGALSAQSPSNPSQQRFQTPLLTAYDPVADQQVLMQLAMDCEQYSPVVGLETSNSPQGLLLDITGTAQLFAGEQSLANKVLTHFCSQGYVIRIGIADTVGAAWAIARFGDPDKAGKTQLPQNGCHVHVISSGQATSALQPLPIKALRLPTETIGLLRELGLTRIEHLLALPRKSLLARFGNRLLTRIDQALGTVEEVIAAQRPEVPFEAQWPLEHPTVKHNVIEQVLSHLVDHLSHLLLDRGRGALQIECTFDCEKQSMTVQVGLFRPTVHPRHLLDLLQMQLDSRRLPGPVTTICLRVLLTAPLEIVQGELLPDRVRDAPRHLARLIDRLSSRLGTDGVLGVQHRADAQPEYAYRYVPLTKYQNNEKRFLNACAHQVDTETSNQSPDRNGPHERPLILQSPPARLDVVAVVPDGPPRLFHYQKQRYRIVHYWGPERIETAWWRGRCIRRDYYRVETTKGNRFWLFRRLTDGQWFLHGEFG